MTIARNRDGNNSKAERREETSSLKKKTSTDKKDRRKLGIKGEKKTKLFAYSTRTSATKIMKTMV